MCVILDRENNNRRNFDNIPFCINNEECGYTTRAEAILYLGASTAATNHIREHGAEEAINDTLKTIEKIGNSYLTLPQKIHAIKNLMNCQQILTEYKQKNGLIDDETTINNIKIYGLSKLYKKIYDFKNRTESRTISEFKQNFPLELCSYLEKNLTANTIEKNFAFTKSDIPTFPFQKILFNSNGFIHTHLYQFWKKKK